MTHEDDDHLDDKIAAMTEDDVAEFAHARPSQPHLTAVDRKAISDYRDAAEAAAREKLTAPPPVACKTPSAVPTLDDLNVVRKFAADLKGRPEAEARAMREKMLSQIRGLFPELAARIENEPAIEWSGFFVMEQAISGPRPKYDPR